MKKTRDKEINALGQLVKILRPLDSSARKRAIDYANRRLDDETYDPSEEVVTVREMTAEEPRPQPTVLGRDHTLLSPRKERKQIEAVTNDGEPLSPRKTQAVLERGEFTTAQERELKNNL